MWYVSANRDEDIFSGPFGLDVTRTNPRSSGFGLASTFVSVRDWPSSSCASFSPNF